MFGQDEALRENPRRGRKESHLSQIDLYHDKAEIAYFVGIPPGMIEGHADRRDGSFVYF